MHRLPVHKCLYVIFFLVCIAWLKPVQLSGGTKDLTILLSNDDGYDAPGLAALYQALSPIATVIVAAPREDQSGAGHGVTYLQPITFERIKRQDHAEWYAIDARPATCVRVALESLLGEKPDVVISGINRGENLGVVSFSSGTVGAAREAAIKRIPALAISQRVNENANYEETASFVRHLVQQLKNKGQLRPGLFLNVNVPSDNQEKIKGALITRQGLTSTTLSFERRTNPEGKIYFWSIYRPFERDSEGTDVAAFNRGYISITPLQIDQTDTDAIKPLRRAIEDFSSK